MATNETNQKHTKEYTLGSGHLRVDEIEDKDIPKTEDEWVQFLTDFIKEHDVLGRIKGGASVEYTTEKTEDQDDLGYIIIEIIKKEKVELKSGVMTWDGKTLETLCATARVTVNEDTGVVTVKLGGLGNQNNKRYIICFEHYSHLLRVAIIGKNNEGFSFSFNQDSATVIDTVFRAQALDDDGTLLIVQDFRKATDEVKAQILGKTPAQTSGNSGSNSGSTITDEEI